MFDKLRSHFKDFFFTRLEKKDLTLEKKVSRHEQPPPRLLIL
jgi:hypothetical protein